MRSVSAGTATSESASDYEVMKRLCCILNHVTAISRRVELLFVSCQQFVGFHYVIFTKDMFTEVLYISPFQRLYIVYIVYCMYRVAQTSNLYTLVGMSTK